jgi:hypothetical protein
VKIEFPRLSTLVESLGNHFFEEFPEITIYTPMPLYIYIGVFVDVL